MKKMIVIAEDAEGNQYLKYEPKTLYNRYPTPKEIKEFIKNREMKRESKTDTRNTELGPDK